MCLVPDALWIALLGVLAAFGGGPLSVLVFRLVDRRTDPADDPLDVPETVEAAQRALRGGAWIGVLERIAVYAAVLAGSAEALALVVAVKGVGRYPELRSGDHPAVAERFLIGTFVSVLWACGCAGLGRWVLA